MRVELRHDDEQLARRAVGVLWPVCEQLGGLWDQELAQLFITHGVVVVEVWAKDGVSGSQAVGATTLALLLDKWGRQDREPLRLALAELLRRIRAKQDAQRRRRALPYAVAQVLH